MAATIIMLKRQEEASQAQGRRENEPSGAAAELIIFPGVRYERWEGDREQDELTNAAGLQGERDWLKI